MHIVANNSEFDIDDSTTLLQALRRQGVAANFSCRNGNCGLCEASLNAGRVWLDDKQQFVDAPATLLLCRAFARSDLALSVNITPRTVSRFCRVLSVEKSADGYRVELQLPVGRIPELLPDDAVRLEGSMGTRLIKPSLAPSQTAHRVLVLNLRDDDQEWMAAIGAGSVRILLPVRAEAVSTPAPS